MHKKNHLKSPTTGRRRKAFLREPGTQRQVSAKTLWFLSQAGDAAGGRARFEVGGVALQSVKEEVVEEGEGRMKEREAPSEHVTRLEETPRPQWSWSIAPAAASRRQISGLACSSEKRGRRRWTTGRDEGGAPDAAGMVTDMRGLPSGVARSPLRRGSATALWL